MWTRMRPTRFSQILFDVKPATPSWPLWFEWVACAQEEELSKYAQGCTRYFFICHTARNGWWTAVPDCTFFVTCCERQRAISKVIIIDLVVPGWFDARQSSCTLSMRSVRLPSFRRSSFSCMQDEEKSQKHNESYNDIWYTWIFQVCKICAFSPKKPTKKQKFYIYGRSRYTSLVESPGARRHLPYICCLRLSSRFGYEFWGGGRCNIFDSEPMQHLHSHIFL